MKSNHQNKQSYASKFRANRVRKLRDLLLLNNMSEISILDVGGTINYWEMNLKYFPKGLISTIDVVNLPSPCDDDTTLEIEGVVIRSYRGNALQKETFRLANYDLIHSNSVIEHVGNLANQKKMADAVLSLNTYHWIQTPAKSFPLEPHFYVPFFAYFPLTLKTFLLTRFNLGFHKRERNQLQARITCEETRLLTKSEFSLLFVASEILREKVFFITKSYIATNLTQNK